MLNPKSQFELLLKGGIISADHPEMKEVWDIVHSGQGDIWVQFK
jgi:hypothetical protein